MLYNHSKVATVLFTFLPKTFDIKLFLQSQWNSAFLTFSCNLKGASKRFCNFWCLWSQFTTKTFVL